MAELSSVIARLAREINLPLHEATVTPQPGGLTNLSYRLDLAGRRFVLRLPGAGTADYIDRGQEACNARIAAELGLHAEVFYAAADGIQLTAYIEHSEALTGVCLRRPEQLTEAVKLLQSLHRSGRGFQGHMQLFPMLDKYLAVAARRHPATDNDDLVSLRQLRRQLEPLRPVLEAGAEPECPCHIDPSPANFLRARARAGQKSELYLVDWEYSAMCEPMWDLACLANEARFDSAQDAALLALYYGAGATGHSARLALYKGLLGVLGVAWALAQAEMSGGRSDVHRRFVSEGLRQGLRWSKQILSQPHRFRPA